jgi:hypothetical protein
MTDLPWRTKSCIDLLTTFRPVVRYSRFSLAEEMQSENVYHGPARAILFHRIFHFLLARLMSPGVPEVFNSIQFNSMCRLISTAYEKRPRIPCATKVCLTCFD